MPYRTLPPHRRPWWEQLAGVWMALLVAMGVIGLMWPSVTLRSALGAGQVTFSALLIGLGSAALVAWWHGSSGARDAERIFMVGLALLSLAHGGALWIIAGDTGAQTGVRIIAAGVGTLAWVGIRYEFGLSRTAVEEAVAVLEDRDDGEG